MTAIGNMGELSRFMLHIESIQKSIYRLHVFCTSRGSNNQNLARVNHRKYILNQRTIKTSSSS